MSIFKQLFCGAAGTSPGAIPANALLIDVRSAEEYAGGHLEGALSLPLVCLTQQVRALAPDPDRPVVVYCLSGARSATARAQLLAMGYREVINGGGVSALAARMGRAIVP